MLLFKIFFTWKYVKIIYIFNFLKFIFDIYISKLFIKTKKIYFEAQKIKILMKNKLNLTINQALNPWFSLVPNKIVDQIR
jgi:hypothetical protein